MLNEPLDFGGQGVAATCKRPQAGAIDDFGEPVARLIGFDMASAFNRRITQCPKIDGFGINRLDGSVT